MQQVTAENLRRGFVVKTLSRSVIIGTDQPEQALIGYRGQVGFPREPTAHSSDGIFNAALLPRCMRIAEKGAHREFMESVVVGELCTIIEGDRTT